MRAIDVIAALLVAAAAVAQDVQSTACELAHLRAALDAWNPTDYAIAIAVIDGQQPVILCSKRAKDRSPTDPNALIPLGSLARLLIADAVHVRVAGKLDVPASVVIANTKPSIVDLLHCPHSTTNLLPDYWDWREGSKPITTATLLACAEVAARAGFDFTPDRASMADLMVLEQDILKKGEDWASFLRVALSPLVSGLAPRDAQLLTDSEWSHLPQGTIVARSAKPTALRLMVHPRDLGNWWQWRLRSSVPNWEGFRMGYLGPVKRRAEIQSWTFEDFGNTPVKTLAVIYPQQKSGLLCISVGAPRWIPEQEPAAINAFEADLFGELEEDPQLGAGGWMGARGVNLRPLADWKAQTWTADAGSDPCVLRFQNPTHGGLSVEFDGMTYQSVQALAASERGGAMRIVVSIDTQRGGVLWLLPDEKTGAKRSMTAVFVQRGEQYTVPHLLRLTLEAQ